MKKLFTFLILSSGIIAPFIVQAQPSTESGIIFLNKENLFSVIDKSADEFHLIYSYGNWCKPCKETFPKLIDLISNGPNLEFYPLLVDKPSKIVENLDVLRTQYDYVGATYAADNSHGKKYYDQYKNFIATIAPSHSEYGMSLIMLFNKKGEMLYATTYHQSTEEKLKGLKKILDGN